MCLCEQTTTLNPILWLIREEGMNREAKCVFNGQSLKQSSLDDGYICLSEKMD